jgi:hypothetical protein
MIYRGLSKYKTNNNRSPILEFSSCSFADTLHSHKIGNDKITEIMGCLKLYGLFVALLTSAALANPVNIPKRNISSRNNVNGFSYHLPTLPDIAALPTNVQERGLLDHLPTFAGPARSYRRTSQC